jgi:hypothetical protein
MSPATLTMVSTAGETCDKITCGQRAANQRRLGVGLSRYRGTLCQPCLRDFDQTWHVWRRLSQPADCEQVRVRCAQCERAGAAKRWFRAYDQDRVVNLCVTHLRYFDRDVATWALVLIDAAMDDVLEDDGRGHLDVASEIREHGREGRSATWQMRSLIRKQEIANRRRPKPVYVRAPRGYGWDFGDWHFTEASYEKIVDSGLNPLLVTFAAAYPETTGHRYDADHTFTVLSRGDSDEAIYVVVDNDRSEIHDAYGSLAWAALSAVHQHNDRKRRVPA